MPGVKFPESNRVVFEQSENLEVNMAKTIGKTGDGTYNQTSLDNQHKPSEEASTHPSDPSTELR